jgi:hypothetical protein
MVVGVDGIDARPRRVEARNALKGGLMPRLGLLAEFNDMFRLTTTQSPTSSSPSIHFFQLKTKTLQVSD